MALTYFLRGGCAIYLVVKKSIRYVPETANVPEDGATLHVQHGPNCAIYPIFNLNPFFRDWTFRSSKRWKSKGCVCVCSTKVFRGKDFSLLNRWRNHLGQCHPIAGERRKGKGKGERGRRRGTGKGMRKRKEKAERGNGDRRKGKGKGKEKGKGERERDSERRRERRKEKGESERDREHDFSSWSYDCGLRHI